MDLRKLLCFFLLSLQLCTFEPYHADAQQLQQQSQQQQQPQTQQPLLLLSKAPDIHVATKQTTITGSIITARIVTIQYKTMEGNQPQVNKNWVGIWQSNQVLYNTAPLRKKYITGTSSDGDLAFDSLEMERKDYIIGYGVGDSNQTVAATLLIKADAIPLQRGIPFATKVEVVAHGNNYLVVNFTTPLGNNPKKNKNWIGVWQGKTFSPDGSNLIFRQEANAVINEDAVAINDLKLTQNTWYTITYSVGSTFQEIVATYTFFNN